MLGPPVNCGVQVFVLARVPEAGIGGPATADAAKTSNAAATTGTVNMKLRIVSSRFRMNRLERKG
jgi:hypothetical protein